MSRVLFKLLLVCAVVMTPGVCPAQRKPLPIRIPPGKGKPPAVVRDVAIDGSDRSVAAGAETDVSTKESTPVSTESALRTQRLQRIQKLTFDRRPSAILKAWSTPPAEMDTEPAAGGEKKPAGSSASAAAADANAGKLKKFDAQLQQIQRDVTLGNWDAVRIFLKQELEEDGGKAAYSRMLLSFRAPPKGVPSQLVRFAEKPVFSVDDVLALIESCPHELDKTVLTGLGAVLRASIASGNDVEKFMERFRTAMGSAGVVPEDDKKTGRKLDGLKIAQLLFNAGQTLKVGEFLPEPAVAIEKQDRDALNLLARSFLARYQSDKRPEFLKQAWEVTQAALSAGEITEQQKQESLARAVELAPKLSEELGVAWLEESFTSRPERGMEILATIGSVVATGLVRQATVPDDRARGLELQQTAVNALLEAAPERAREWSPTLNLLARNWLMEAEHSRLYDAATSRRPTMQRDIYGNYFYSTASSRSSSVPGASSRTPRAISTGKLLDLKPEGEWLQVVDEPLQPRFQTILPQLYLKMQEEDKAFPYIEAVARTHPDVATDLAEEFLRVWTSNHDPNSSRRRTNIYMFSYGFNRRAQGIPLTRSKQERNLRELSGWVRRIREVPIDDIDESILVNAFTSTHGTAEVYHLENIESVFGSLDALDPETLAQLIQKMRQNLAGVWRMPATQKDAKTNRRQKDIQAEVRRGYETANAVLRKGREMYPENWSLQLVRAAMMFDENEYDNELENSSEYSKRRADAVAAYRTAAERYGQAVSLLEEEKQTARIYEGWFYASLGASDIGQIKPETQPDLNEVPRIREAILALPGDLAERHMDMFANSLFTRLSAVNAAVKFRYLRAGFEIVQDNKRAEEARSVFDYYNDLVTEVELRARIDGSDVVGHEAPFGVFIDIYHTKEIERESGGFSKYLQNQNNGFYAYNYGRPTENYRDKFEEACIASLGEHFEVLSVTFQREDVNSRATEKDGWRFTPYAYLLLKALGPEVDTIPAVRLDLDFLDTSGYAVLPVETAPTPIDAGSGKTAARPVSNVSITQTLDERQADEGRLILEISATGLGLVPGFEKLLRLAPKEFDVVGVEDEGVTVSQFDKESTENTIVSERNLLVTLEAKANLSEHPQEFQFGEAEIDDAELAFQRYVDADLASVESTISLDQTYGELVQWWPWYLGGACMAAMILGAVLVRMKRTEVPTGAYRFTVPESVTPFTVIGLLRDIQANNGISADGTRELNGAISRIEQYYFFESDGAEPDLTEIAEAWATKAN